MNINIIYDASVNNAPSGFKAAVADAVQFLDSVFTSSVTINIDVGYGEVDGQTLSSSALGQSLTIMTPVTYAQLEGALPAGTLPSNDPTLGGNFEIAIAEARALGLLGASGNIDGFVGFSSTAAFTYDPNNRAVSGAYDFISVFEHEITEVMGRISKLGTGSYSLMDLFRYSAPGAHNFVGTQTAYFSIDGGATNLDNFNTTRGGDFGDWAVSAGHDTFLAFSSSGVMNTFSSADVTLMDVLGYGQVSSSNTKGPIITAVVDQPATDVLNAGKNVVITLDFNEAVTLSSGVPSLALNDGGKATYASGSGSALTFNYTVASTDSDVTSLIVTSVNLNGTTIVDGSGQAANLSLVGLPQSGPQIDATVPAIAAIIEQPGTGDFNVGKTVTITLAMNEAVSLSGGTPTLNLNDHGVATYASGSGSSSLVFHYTIGPNDIDVASLAVSSISLDGATIQDIAGNIANLSLTGVIQSGPQIDTTIPVVTIANAGGVTVQPIQMVSGSVDLENVGTTVTLFDGSKQIGVAKVQADGQWSIDVTLSTGAHSLTAQDLDGAGNIGTSHAVEYTVSPIGPPAGILDSLTAPEEIAAIYVGYFDRAPDAGGFAFWEGQYVGHGLSTDQALTAIANSFAPQPETLALYPFLASAPLSPNSQADESGTEALVSGIYSNLFNRAVNAATDAGAQFWVHALLNGQAALGQAVLDIANGAQGADAQVLLNKVIASDYFVAATAAAGLGVNSAPAPLLAEARSVLIGVGADAGTIAGAEVKIDAFLHA